MSVASVSTNTPPAAPSSLNVPAQSVAARPTPLVLTSQGVNPKSYQVLKKLGDGAEGDVWEALTPGGNNHVAIKVNKAGQTNLARFLQEVAMHRSIQDARHILQIRGDFDLAPVCYGNGDQNLCLGHEQNDERRHAIVMDLLPCVDAYELALRNGISAFSYDRILDIATQGLETLQDLKSRGVVHRDVKPENMVYYPETGECFVFDFGFAKQKSKIKQGETLGTRQYQAPEMILGKLCDESVDIWSFGCTLFTLYTVTSLFQPGECNGMQEFIDHLHIMTQQMGPMSSKFIESAPGYRKFFKMGSDGIYAIKFSPSRNAVASMDWFANYPRNKPFWQTRIYEAAAAKGESPEKAIALVDLLSPMLQYENRITPEAALKWIQLLKSKDLKASVAEEKESEAVSFLTHADAGLAKQLSGLYNGILDLE